MYVEPIIDGPVEISFADSSGKQKVTLVVDFGETDLPPSEAAKIFKEIVQILRLGLNIELSRCQ